MDTLGHLAALHVTPANADDRAEAGGLAKAVQAATGSSVELGYVDQGNTGQRSAEAAQAHDIALEVIKLSEAKQGFVLLPWRWVIERSFAWAARFRRVARDDERLPATLAGLHVVAFARLVLNKATALFDSVRNYLEANARTTTPSSSPWSTESRSRPAHCQATGGT